VGTFIFLMFLFYSLIVVHNTALLVFSHIFDLQCGVSGRVCRIRPFTTVSLLSTH
jgi:hypothetical protein